VDGSDFETLCLKHAVDLASKRPDMIGTPNGSVIGLIKSLWRGLGDKGDRLSFAAAGIYFILKRLL